MKANNYCFILLFTCYFFCFEALAGEAEKKTKELTGLQTKIKQINSTINNLKAKKNSLIAELKTLDIQFGNSAIQLKELKQQIATINSTLKKNQQKINIKQGQVDKQKRGLERQIKVAYSVGRNDKLKLMLNQQDPAVSGRILTYYDYFNKVRLKKISKIDSDLQQLHSLKQLQDNESALLLEKLSKENAEQATLVETREKQKKLLKKIGRHFDTKSNQLKHFKSNEARLKKLIIKLQQATDDFPFEEDVVKKFSKLKGKLPWPIKGKILKKFGAKRSISQWDGVLIKARSGANIRAVTGGIVVYADWLRGYGLLTIIEHGKDYMSLYAFNQSLYKSVGDWVDAGTVIASAGQSGGQSETGLYFGIRKQGKPVNPEKWCRKTR
ncbi:MAG: peptidoglycan DD-metalloendopeptidase family protein [Methylococcales symbiont of Hymedesmia sp. n. MRB-2018]|nr:MAG: peptidoglycan DD-metalloendopeptidase family protein [Methylococcales symbiont of Hymedesmia sp. n. MRB-2018]KAF3984357.1 MAG: peptidoglycan DD-metalloendopeptidase family protein [Methylococcales symbiont of Hymedesmia sp. n. MRB-2018]